MATRGNLITDAAKGWGILLSSLIPSGVRHLAARLSDHAPVKRSPSILWRPPVALGGYGAPPPASTVAEPIHYLKSEAVFAAVNAFANRIISTQLTLSKRDRAGDLEDVNDHPAMSILANPNQFLTRSELFWHTVSDLKLAGNAYWFLAGPQRGAPTEIWRLNPRSTRVVPSKTDYIAGYITIIDEQAIPLDVSEVIHFRRPNPFDEFYGLGDMAAAILPAISARKMEEWNFSTFARDYAVPAGIVSIEDWLEDDKFQQLKADWLEMYGDSRRRTAFLRGGKMQFQPIGLNQVEMDYLNSAKWQAEKIYRVFGTYHLLPAQYADDRRVNERQFLEEHAWPMLVYLAEVITDQFLTYWGPREGTGQLIAQFEDIRPREQIIDLQLQQEEAKGLTLKEWRDRRKLPDLEGAEDIMFVHVQSGEKVEFEKGDPLVLTPGFPPVQPPQAQQQEQQDDDQNQQQTPDDEQAEEAESAGNEVGDDVGGSTERQIDPAQIAQELERWRKFAVARLGRRARPFNPEAIPPGLYHLTSAALAEATDQAAVGNVFHRANELIRSRDSEQVLADLANLHEWIKSGDTASLPAFDIPVDTMAYGRALRINARTADQVIPLMRSHYAEHHGQDAPRVYRAFEVTAASYRSILNDLISRAFDVNPVTGESALDKDKFIRQGREAISIHFRAAYLDGLAEGGVWVDEIDPDEKRDLDLEVKAERGFWGALAKELYSHAIPLYLEALALQDDATIAETAEERQALQNQYLSLYAQFLDAQAQFLNRIERWVIKGLTRIFNLGKISAQSNQMMEWELGQTEQHCATCQAASGQRHRAKDWKRYGILPQSDTLECGGWLCDCKLTPTTERAKGRLDRIPTKHYHHHESEEHHASEYVVA